MEASFINPCINATLNVLQTMCSTEAVAGKPYIKKDRLTHGVVTGFVGITSNKIAGNLIVSFDERSIVGIVSRLIGEEFEEVGPDVVDAVGEITNMIIGGVKKELNKDGHIIDMAIPATILGQHVEISQLSKEPVIVVPFSTKDGTFVVECNICDSSRLE